MVNYIPISLYFVLGRKNKREERRSTYIHGNFRDSNTQKNTIHDEKWKGWEEVVIVQLVGWGYIG